MLPVFDPQDASCKSPFGAAQCGAEVTFTLRDETYYACELLVHREFAGADEAIPLPPAEGGFSGVYTAPAEPELCWYAFRFTRGDGSTVCLGRNGWCGQDALARWQLTVYEYTPTPAWFGEGVTYQIFPDRFRRTSVPDVAGMVGRRWVHDDWDDQPVFLPDENGQITNRDFFGGSLAGITEKLDYLKSLSVSTIYLNPIFEADSNHRYNTADYRAVDPMLGTEEDFRTLCREAHDRGIRIILDGVFNHTGSNSRYFNADGFYPEPGAAQSKDSPYFPWYSFHPWPTEYDAWWGIHTLPAVNEDAPDYRRFIISDEDSVVRRWLRLGADGWRLDVADEIPHSFWKTFRRRLRALKPDVFLVGEIWNQAAVWLMGDEFDGVTNYKYRGTMLSLAAGESDADAFWRRTHANLRLYKTTAWPCLVNLLGSHDTARLFTQVPDKRMAALALLVTLCMEGMPLLYYGDEVGMEGGEDPDNRRAMQWDADPCLLDEMRAVGQLRRRTPVLRTGTTVPLAGDGSLLRFLRRDDSGSVCVTANFGQEARVLHTGEPPLYSLRAQAGGSGRVRLEAGGLYIVRRE